MKKPSRPSRATVKAKTPHSVEVMLSRQDAFSRIETLSKEGGVVRDSDLLKPEDIVDYCDFKVSGGIRDACFAVDLAIRSGRDFAAAVQYRLRERWQKQTVDDIFNTGRNVIPWLRSHNLIDYRDPNNLRMVMTVLKDPKHAGHAALVDGIKQNLSYSKLKKLLQTPETNNGEIEREDSRELPSEIGSRFEVFVESLLTSMYPDHSWSHLGRVKAEERGLDFFGKPFDVAQADLTLGVQVKCHKARATPNTEEWLKFLAGCFTRRVRNAIFITTGKLTGNQYREAQEAQIITVIDGLDKINRLASKHGIPQFTIEKS